MQHCMMLIQRTLPTFSHIAPSSNSRWTTTKICFSQTHCASLTSLELVRYSCGDCVRAYLASTCSMAPDRCRPQQYSVALTCSRQQLFSHLKTTNVPATSSQSAGKTSWLATSGADEEVRAVKSRLLDLGIMMVLCSDKDASTVQCYQQRRWCETPSDDNACD